MLILGLLLLAGAGVFTGLVIADNTSGGPEYDVSVLGHSIATMNSLEIFCAGLALALIFCLGIVMAMVGGASRRHRSRKLAAARRAAADNARERDALAARLGTADGTGTEPAWAGDSPAGRDARDGKAAYADTAATDTGGAQPSGETRPEEVDAPRHRHTRHIFGH
jgi:hypothetical protein